MQRELKQCKSQMAEQHKTLVEYSNRMDEYDKKNEETNRKFSTLLQVSIKLNFLCHLIFIFRVHPASTKLLPISFLFS